MDTNATTKPEVSLYAGELGEDHPGFTDAAYRARRAEIAAIAEAYVPGAAIPRAPYVDEEHDVWRQVLAALHRKHREVVPDELVAASERLGLPDDHVPQLDEVTALLAPLSGYRYEPVAGLVAPKDFYSALGERRFMSTQYIRHASAPFYTPEPDVIHEVAGHGVHLASSRFSKMYVDFGRTVASCETDEAVTFLSRFFWHTMEFGVVRHRGDVLVYGAGILSSVGELDAYRDQDIRDWDVIEMGTRSYDITRYQDVLFAAESLDHLEHEWYALLDGFDDDKAHRLTAMHAPA